VVCDRNVNSRAAKGDVVCHAGAAWMVLANMAFEGVAAGDKLCKYITSSNKEEAGKGTISYSKAPTSRSPPGIRGGNGLSILY
jgi:hypothetical protein